MQALSHPGAFGRTARTVTTLGLALLGLASLVAPGHVAADAAPAASTTPAFRALVGHIPPAVAQAQAVAALDASRPLSLALTLPLRHQDEMDDLLRGLADPNDARYGQFLTPQQFVDRFSPTQADYDHATTYARSVGLTVVGTHPNRTLLDVTAPAGQVERAFGLHLLVYQSRADGRYFYAPDAEPRIPAAMASIVSGIVGLDNAAQWHPHLRLRPTPVVSPFLDPYVLPLETGSGPGGGLTPSDIKKAYNLTGATQTGSGQTLALFELDGYKASDITGYEAHYGLPAVPLTNVLVDSYSGAAGSNADEVTLDIELQAALAPAATKILVYEAPNSSAGVMDAYNKIATDNLAKSISTSWGEAENSAGATIRNSENMAFKQMASQGQSIFAASGDSGAYDNGSGLSVDDPASQPYMTGVGGTFLTTSGAGGPYSSEKTWSDASDTRRSPFGAGGGGGFSTVWAIPPYQSGVAGSAASKGSTTMRNVPDVSLAADPNTGYSIFFNNTWYIFGGTSCAAPLWSAFTALVNQQRAANGLSTLGFANTPLYALAKTASYSTDFHDIADGSTNLYYPAVTGYDDATGLGTFNGANLLTDLSGGSAPPTIPAAPTNLKATAGNASVALTWNASTGATTYNLYRATTTGTETLLKSGLTTTSDTDTGLTNATTYFYQVTAVNSGGESTKSAEVSVQPTTLINGSFETPSVGASSYRYNPTGAGWTFTGSSGIQANGSGWGAAPAPDGTQTAFLQGHSGGATLGSLSQSVSVAAAGTYTLTFQAARRQGQVQPLAFSVDGVAVGSLLTPAGSSFALVTTGSFALSAGAHTLMLAATDSTTDKSTFLDQVTLNQVASATLVNGSFEAPSVGASSYRYNPTGAGWTFTGSSGIQANGSGWGAAPAPDGTQTAFLQGHSGGATLGSLSQSVSVAAAGTYTLTFQAARRQGQVQPLAFSVDGVAVGSLLTPAGSSFALVTTGSFTLSAGAHVLALAATDNTADKSTFLDQMSLVKQ